MYVGNDVQAAGFWVARCRAEDVSQCAGQAGTPAALPGAVRGMRIEPTTKALFMASDSVIVICQDANNAASLGGCVVDSAGGLLSVPFDVAFKDSKLYIADRGVSSSSAGDGWIVRCDICGLGTANPSLSGCTQLWGTNTAGQTGSSGNNVNFDRPRGIFIEGSLMYVPNTGTGAGVTTCTIDGSYDLVQCSNNFGLLTDGTSTAWSASRFVAIHDGRAYVTGNGIWICTNPTQLTGCTKLAITVLTDTTGTSTQTVSLTTFGMGFYGGKVYITDYTQNVVVVCDDPVALTGCRRLYACSGASTPTTVNKGCQLDDNTIKSPLRMAFYPPS